MKQIHPDLVKVKEELGAAIEQSSKELGSVLTKAKQMDRLYRAYLEEAEKVYEELCEAESELNEENVDKLRLQYEKVADSWTNECTKWYDIYLDEMYPESDF